MLLITAAAALVTHDLLAVWNMQTRLELDAVHMAAAGVEFLPGAPARATLAAAHSAALCDLALRKLSARPRRSTGCRST
jgi:hypothetical protein